MKPAISSPLFRLMVFSTLFLVSISGCTTIHHMNTPEFIPEYVKKQDQFPLKVALVVPEETRKFAFTIPTVRWEVGAAVATHMASGLQAVFKEVAVVKDEKIALDFDRKAVCSLGKQTEYQRGMFVSSDQTFIISLDCAVYDRAGRRLWAGEVLHKNVYNAGLAAKMLMASAAAAVILKSGDTASAQQGYQESLNSGMNETLIVAVDQMMAKMISEGKVAICPDCKVYPEWHKPLGK